LQIVYNFDFLEKGVSTPKKLVA